MTAEARLLLAVLALGLINLAWIAVGWLVDRHVHHAARHRKEHHL
ncbi:hypothetical protein ACFW9O_25155 [Streptomyces sp. NPDC059499]